MQGTRFGMISGGILATILALSSTGCGNSPSKPEARSESKSEPARTASPTAAGSSSAASSSLPPMGTVITPPQQLNTKDTTRPTGVAGVRSRLLDGRTITLPPIRPLQVNTRCNFINETGYKGDAVVEVKEGIVLQMRVLVDVPEPNKGRCVFDMSGMVQTKSVPSIELLNQATGCTARMWEQGETAVVSFSNCATSCTSRESFKYVWPVLINRSANHCD
ncbi:MAG: hypothetical protein JWL63_2198 [Rhodocyclales bacterium]|nr:hypothetical protein [Rhodocyclales bacterium]